jgi:GNAT superfamily N-acetyltransferase
LNSYALTNQRSDSAQTYIALTGRTAVGYYSLAVGSVVYDDAPERLGKGLPRHSVPVMILARLAVDLRMRSKGLGAGLLADALRRTIAAADIAGIRAIVVHAKDDHARAFYEHFGFVGFGERALTLYVLLKDIRLRRDS